MEEYSLCKSRLYRQNIKEYNKIAIYGVGDGADILYEILGELNLTPRIVCMMDHDLSDNIGSKYKDIEVRKMSESIHQVDVIIVAARIHHDIIRERILNYCNEYGIDKKVIDPFLSENSAEDCQKYVEYLEKRTRNTSQQFVPITDTKFIPNDKDPKLIAWYLPQYYQIPVNDQFHGKGFTEWTNSSKAIPLYVGHDQPHIPYDVGYYDLSNINAMKRQVELAKLYGIYGFCFHYYWFSGERIMEKPLEMLLEHKEIDMPFCLNWATENWTALWDGGDNSLIYEQKLQEGDDDRFVDDILPYFKDSRYIRIDNKPVLSVYITTLFGRERFKRFVDNFQKRVRKEGFSGVYIMITTARDFNENVEDWGADALVEFPPAGMKCDTIRPEGYLNPTFKGSIFDYAGYVNERRYLKSYNSKEVYRSALVAFDNSPRKASQEHCVIMHGASAQLFKAWLSDLIQIVNEEKAADKQVIFINSWNEWAESSHLEPDLRFGYANLQGVKEALLENRELDTTVIEREVREKRVTQLEEIHFYIHCIESLGDVITCEPIVRYLKKNYAPCKISWILRKDYVEVVEYNNNIDEIITVDCLNESINLCKEKRKQRENVIIDCHYNHRRCRRTNRIHYNLNNPKVNENTYFEYGSILETFCLSAGLPALNEKPIFYQKRQFSTGGELPEKYVVVHCKSAEKCKDWTDSKWNDLCNYLVGKNISIVEIGFEPVIVSKDSRYYNMTHVRDIQEIAEVIRKAELFIGIDSSFAHIANCFDKMAILIFGSYKNFPEYNPYSGGYDKEKKVRLIRAKSVAAEVLLEEVISAVNDFIE